MKIRWYDERHDPKLYEIWTLAMIGQALRERCGPETSFSPLWQRAQVPIFIFKTPPPVQGTIEVFFQRRAGVLESAPNIVAKWRRDDVASKPYLTGVPDIAVRATDKGRLAIIDAKLRAIGSPADELFKMLGYFNNYEKALGPDCWGGLVYGDDSQVRQSYVSPQGGRLSLISALPSAEAPLDRIGDLVDELLAALGADPRLTRAAVELSNARQAASPQDSEGPSEEANDSAQKAAASYLKMALDASRGDLGVQRAELNRLLPSVWIRLSSESQTMLATAEYFGQSPPLGIDFSPMVLELAATLEWELASRVFRKYVAGTLTDPMFPKGPEEPLTLGAMSWALSAVRKRDVSASSFGNWLGSRPGGLELVNAAKLLADFNYRFRRRAAHTDILESESFDFARIALYGLEGKPCLLGIVAAL